MIVLSHPSVFLHLAIETVLHEAAKTEKWPSFRGQVTVKGALKGKNFITGHRATAGHITKPGRPVLTLLHARKAKSPGETIRKDEKCFSFLERVP